MGDIQIVRGARTDAYAVRRAVFMEEQGYEREFDALDDDPRCVHLAAYEDGALAGCARAYPAAAARELAPESPLPPASVPGVAAPGDTVYLLGRVAVLPAFRGRGVARSLVDACDGIARAAGARAMMLHAQERACGLYAACGYAAATPLDYEDEGQPHRWMAKRL